MALLMIWSWPVLVPPRLAEWSGAFASGATTTLLRFNL
jgi:hypothetical protein